MTHNFELITFKLRRSGKWVHAVYIYKKLLRSHDYTCTNESENTVTLQVVNEFILFYPKMKFLLAKIETFLSKDRQKFLETNTPIFSRVKNKK